jgi:hypothetical protein
VCIIGRKKKTSAKRRFIDTIRVISKVCVYNRKKKKSSMHTIVKGGKLNVYLDIFPYFLTFKKKMFDLKK